MTRRRRRGLESPQLSPPDPDCRLCLGDGWLRRDVPISDPDFGRALPCTCRRPLEPVTEPVAEPAVKPWWV